MRRLNELFENIDHNRDGFITYEEWRLVSPSSSFLGLSPASRDSDGLNKFLGVNFILLSILEAGCDFAI